MAPTVAVIGERGMLGSVVRRRWRELGAEIVTANADYIVNCIRPDDLLFSQRLAEASQLIQPSTDAIAEDTDYAVGKRILEQIPGVVTIRCGLVDVERQPVAAHRNWSCNPLTPLEWADLAWDLRDLPGVHIVGRETVSRYEVASNVAAIWDRPAPFPSWAEVPLWRVQPAGDSWPPLAEALYDYREWLRQS
jgi:hypothetical protein